MIIKVTFQFTHPVRGATRKIARPRWSRQCFNSRTPCGVRRILPSSLDRSSLFQFTHPVRGATKMRPLVMCLVMMFQFTHPVRGATFAFDSEGGITMFQFTHPVRGATESYSSYPAQSLGFNSRTPCGVRLRCSKVRINRGLDDDPLRTEN